MKSQGPQYPGKTEIELLEHGSLTRFGARLFKVRVRSDAKVGFAFVGVQDLQPGCAVTWEDEPDAERKPNVPLVPGGHCLVKKPTALQQRDDLITRACKEPSEDSHAPVELDLDGDGRMDALLNLPDGGSEYQVLALHTAKGWTGYSVGMGSSDADGAQSDWITPIRTRSAVYARLSRGAQYDGGEEERDANTNYQTQTLYRVRADGALFEVWSGDVEGGERGDWELKDAGDGSLMISGKSGRQQLLRWDPTLWRLVPQRILLKPQVP